MATEVTLESIMRSITDMKQSFNSSTQEVNSRVDDLAQRRPNSRTPSPRPKRPGNSRSKPAEWHLRTDTVLDIPPDAEFGWEDHDEQGCSSMTAKLSEETEVILATAMTSTLSNAERKEVREKYTVPNSVLTRTPKLDEIFTASEYRFQKNTEARAVERDLFQITTCTLDVARPLLDLIEGVNSEEFTLEDAKEKAAVQTFLKNQSNKRVLLLLDNTTAVSYINHLGGTVSPQATHLVKDLWLWCLRQSISLKAQHLPGKENVIADRESRVMRDRSDWMLNPTVFHKLQSLQEMEIDLFASRLTSQLPQYFSWRPDPLAIATDAFLQDWSNMKAYANAPWNLIGRVLAKIQEHQNTWMILITPLWTSQSWYPVLLDLLVDMPRLLPETEDLILQT